jgi:hypothetical protein
MVIKFGLSPEGQKVDEEIPRTGRSGKYFKGIEMK